jgi:hypothetical protein
MSELAKNSLTIDQAIEKLEAFMRSQPEEYRQAWNIVSNALCSFLEYEEQRGTA